MAEVYNIYMNNLEISLNKIAETILHLDEASLASLWENIKAKWKIFLIQKNGKKQLLFLHHQFSYYENSIFNEKLIEPIINSTSKKIPERHKETHYLKLVK